MEGGYWKGVPIELIENWRSIFSKNKEGPNLSASCPVCHNKGLHRYYQAGKKMIMTTGSDQFIAKGAEWQWCSFCRSFEHAQVLVPDWWVPSLEIDGNKLTAIPDILNMAYQDAGKVNKWNRVPEQYLKLWDKIFSENQGEAVLKENCPVCNRITLLQYYSLNVHGPIKYKKKLYKGQGAHWEWCAFCFHYKYENLTYVPLEWTYELEIEPWELMSIPEPINEKMR